ncbi:ABC transporter permease subunit [Alkalithermobacter paradoxus]|uniref:Branched-chain amino acid transport system / permease component n=1 Tax=Alkalithermobacter paradoxus TaxID=29349 RepID=A0A1V4I9B9_9FIRM|nr:branched-chain amino acid transport system / permease component [[Clostridium] thermoalcaliphilum]
MADKIKQITKALGVPRLIIISFFITLCILAVILKLPISMILSDTLVRTGMNGILVLAMVPGILSGIGLNFGLPLGIVCGLLGGLISIELNLSGFTGLFVAIIISIPISAVVGYFYGLLLNKVKGSEMMVSTYVGFSAISLMCIGWLVMPFTSAEIKWPIGEGLRTTIALTSRYDKVLNSFLSFRIGKIIIPTGLWLFFLGCCFAVWLFLRSKSGIAMKACGDNPKFAIASGIDVDKSRILGTMISTILGAVGIIIYAQSYGFYQLYQAPMMMGFAAVAAILIGGSSARSSKISHVILGTFLFQGLLTVSLPVANKIVTEGNLSEVARIIVQNGIILYALTKVGAGD